MSAAPRCEVVGVAKSLCVTRWLVQAVWQEAGWHKETMLIARRCLARRSKAFVFAYDTTYACIVKLHHSYLQ